jgi:hypothetical protein
VLVNVDDGALGHVTKKRRADPNELGVVGRTRPSSHHRRGDFYASAAIPPGGRSPAHSAEEVALSARPRAVWPRLLRRMRGGCRAPRATTQPDTAATLLPTTPSRIGSCTHGRSTCARHLFELDSTAGWRGR